MTTRFTALETWRPALALAFLSVLCPAPAQGQVNGTFNHIIKFDSPTTGGDSRLFDNGFNVGIGTTSPQDFLHLYRGNPIRSTVGVLMGNSTTGSGRRGFLVDYHGTGGAELWNFENTNMWFATNNTRRMVITNTGRVTLDSTIDANGSPGSGALEIAGALRLDQNEIITNNNSTLFLNHDNNGDVRMDSTTFVLDASTNQVGIGGFPTNTRYQDGSVNAPRLDVRGNVRIENIPVWNGRSNHDLTWARGFSNGVDYNPDKRIVSREGSSRRYKTDIQPMAEDFSKILDVEAKQYKMRKGYGPPDAWNYGLIAEDLDEAGLHNLVIYDEEGRPDGVKYKKVALYVNEVVKTQQQTIEELQAEVAALREMVGALGAR